MSMADQLAPRDAQGAPVTLEGKIISGPNGETPFKDNERAVALFTDRGHLLVSGGHRDSPTHRSIKVALASIYRKAVSRETFVPQTVISDFYAALADGGDAQFKVTKEVSNNQKRIINLLREMVEADASDLHLIVEKGKATVQIRVGGIVIPVRDLVVKEALEMMGSAFALNDAGAATYMPGAGQDARIAARDLGISNKVEAFRGRWNPLSGEGREVILRALYRESNIGGDINDDLAALGYDPKQAHHIRELRQLAYGGVIFAGKVNSGKSTSLKVILEGIYRERNGEIKINTVEDPVEFMIRGAQQISVPSADSDEKREANYIEAIRGLLRSDIDVGMIGELRDQPSTRLFFQIAMNGSLAFTTLHASGAMVTMERLRDLGAESWKLYDPDNVSGVIAQRLVATLCPGCKVPFPEAVKQNRIDPDVVRRTTETFREYGLSTDTLYSRGTGCPTCQPNKIPSPKGLKGRTVVAEIIRPDDEFMDLMKAGRKKDARDYWLRDTGGFTMASHGFLKLLDGQIGPEGYEGSIGGLMQPNPFTKSFLADRALI